MVSACGDLSGTYDSQKFANFRHISKETEWPLSPAGSRPEIQGLA